MSKHVTLGRSTGSLGRRGVLWSHQEDAWDQEQGRRLGLKGLRSPAENRIEAVRQHRAKGVLSSCLSFCLASPSFLLNLYPSSL